MSDKIKGTVQANKIHIIEFKILKGQIESPEDFITDNVKGYEFLLGLKIGFNYSELLSKADFTVEVSSLSDGKNKTEAKAIFHFVFIFKIDNLDELTTGKGDGRQVTIVLGNTLASISHSTARGILLTRFQGTSLQNFILPVIDPSALLINKKETGRISSISGKARKSNS